MVLSILVFILIILLLVVGVVLEHLELAIKTLMGLMAIMVLGGEILLL